MRARGLLAAVGVVALVASACSSGDSGAGTATTAPGRAGGAEGAGPVTLPVSVDALPEDFSASFFGFFPQALTARPGDTVEFLSDFTGEPHTVAFGTIIDEALAAFDATPAGTPASAETTALLAKAPPFFSPTATNPDADPLPAAAQPCFLATGAPPQEAACVDQPKNPAAFDGTQSFYSSGFLPDEASFKLNLADDIAPGTYRFMCLVDRTEMTGTLTVVAPGTEIPSPGEVRQQGEDEIAQAVERVRPAAEKAKAITAPDAATAGAPNADIGAPAAGARRVSSTVNVFPDELAVPTGGQVSWALHGAHMIAFNAPEDARPLYAFDTDGVVRANKKGALPSGSPPKQPGGKLVDGGQFDGTGFRNSGLLVGEGDLTYRLSFTKPGTYTYKCLFHTDMEGRIKVG